MYLSFNTPHVLFDTLFTIMAHTTMLKWTVYSRLVNLTEIFHIDDIVVTVSWTQQPELESSTVSYNISVFPQTSFSQGYRNVTLRMVYNTAYTVSIVASLCQQNVSSIGIILTYGKPSYSAIGKFKGLTLNFHG